MKMTLSVLLFTIFFIQISFGQVSGIYELKYVGSIKSDSITNFKISLPTTSFFHTKDKKSSLLPRTYEYKINGLKIESVIKSHITSIRKSEQLIELYKNNRDFIPVIITVLNSDNIEKKQSKKIPINQIEFKGTDKSKQLTQIIINLGKIEI